jgi:hypothetical protein
VKNGTTYEQRRVQVESPRSAAVVNTPAVRKTSTRTERHAKLFKQMNRGPRIVWASPTCDGTNRATAKPDYAKQMLAKLTPAELARIGGVKPSPANPTYGMSL